MKKLVVPEYPGRKQYNLVLIISLALVFLFSGFMFFSSFDRGITGGASFGFSVTANNNVSSVNFSYYEEQVGSKAGSAIDSGDFNGDGIKDLLIGAYGFDSGAGKAYVVLGPFESGSHNLNESNFTLLGETDDNLTYSVAVGDVDNDGFDDMLLGAPGYNNQTGRVYLKYGLANLSGDVDANSSDVELTGDNNADRAGYSVEVGDLNGDNYDDIVVGAPLFDAGGGGFFDAGKVYVFFGPVASGSFVLNLSNVSFEGMVPNDGIGSDMVVGDFNGDGSNDLVIGASAIDKVYLVYGPITQGMTGPIALSTNITFNGTIGSKTGDKLTLSVGDVNDDNYDDLLIGAPYDTLYGGFWSGRAFLVYGNATLNSSIDLNSSLPQFYPEAVDDEVGYSTAVGLYNNDSYADILIGAPGNDEGGNVAGKIYLFYGPISNAAHNASTANESWYGSQAGVSIGVVTAGAAFGSMDEASSGLIGTLDKTPTANAGGPYAANEGSVVNFDASTSFNTQGGALQYMWDYQNDGTYDTTWSALSTASYTWNDDFIGFAKVKVLNKDGLTSEGTAGVTVNNVNPVANANGPYAGNTGSLVGLSGSATDAGTDTFTYNWDLNNDLVYETPGQNVNFNCAADGVYTVNLQVTDDDLGTGTTSTTVTCTTPPPPPSGGPGGRAPIICTVDCGQGETEVLFEEIVDGQKVTTIQTCGISSDGCPYWVVSYITEEVEKPSGVLRVVEPISTTEVCLDGKVYKIEPSLYPGLFRSSDWDGLNENINGIDFYNLYKTGDLRQGEEIVTSVNYNVNSNQLTFGWAVSGYDSEQSVEWEIYKEPEECYKPANEWGIFGMFSIAPLVNSFACGGKTLVGDSLSYDSEGNFVTAVTMDYNKIYEGNYNMRFKLVRNEEVVGQTEHKLASKYLKIGVDYFDDKFFISDFEIVNPLDAVKFEREVGADGCIQVKEGDVVMPENEPGVFYAATYDKNGEVLDYATWGNHNVETCDDGSVKIVPKEESVVYLGYDEEAVWLKVGDSLGTEENVVQYNLEGEDITSDNKVCCCDFLVKMECSCNSDPRSMKPGAWDIPEPVTIGGTYVYPEGYVPYQTQTSGPYLVTGRVNPTIHRNLETGYFGADTITCNFVGRSNLGDCPEPESDCKGANCKNCNNYKNNGGNNPTEPGIADIINAELEKCTKAADEKCPENATFKCEKGSDLSDGHCTFASLCKEEISPLALPTVSK